MLTEGIVDPRRERPAVCSICKAAYTQIAITERFKAWARAAARREGKPHSALDTALPDGWTPPHCPRCESELLRWEDPAPCDPMIVRTYMAPKRGMFGEAADD